MEENPKREFKGIWIPREVWLNRELSYFEKILLAEIDSLDGDNHCYASNAYFCEFFNCKERVIREAISRLKKLGYVKQVSFDGRTRFLTTKTIQEKFKGSAPPKSKLHRKNLRGLTDVNVPVSSIYNNKENSIETPPPPSSNPEPDEMRASKEEEEEIQKRFSERPKNSSKIKNMAMWKAKVLKEIRSEAQMHRDLHSKNKSKRDELQERINRHKQEAKSYDGKTIHGWKVKYWEDYMEISRKGSFTPISYDLSDEVWYDSTPWNIEPCEPNKGPSDRF